MSTKYIDIRNAHQHNLRHLDLRLPLGELIVVTGVSGSGKSTLAFDTIYAEGQRRYVETFSPYARQFLDRMDKPQVDRIDGIPPAIAIDQTNPVRTSRSTVGTMTELNDHLKLLFARAAKLYCTGCGKPIGHDNPHTIATDTLARDFGDVTPRVMVCFTVSVPANFTNQEVEHWLQRQGYTRIKQRKGQQIEVIQDRVRCTRSNLGRLTEAVEASLRYGQGRCSIYALDDERKPVNPRHFSIRLHCAHCDLDYRKPVPSLFSFNSPIGACEACRGFGRTMGIDYNLVIPDESKTLREGAVKVWQTKTNAICQRDMVRHAKSGKVPLDKPWRDLTDKQKQWVIEGNGKTGKSHWYGIAGFFKWLEGRAYKMHVRVMLSKYRSYEMCDACGGARLKPESLQWRLGDVDEAARVIAPANRFVPLHKELSTRRFNSLPGLCVHDVMRLPLRDSRLFFDTLSLAGVMDEATELLLAEIRGRLRYLNEVGLGYLSLDRQSRTLSGGEVQRINLTTALGTSLVNTLFVLDEPSIGLHARDMDRISTILQRLRDAGNSLLVVEHDPQLMFAADRILDMGPGPGQEGGNIVFNGSAAALLGCEQSLTARFLNGSTSITLNRRRTPPSAATLKRGPALAISGAAQHNLANISVKFPLGCLVCVTGPSGSGKSTLVQDILYHALCKHFGKSATAAGQYRKLTGQQHLTDVVHVDQAPIGKSARSNPVSYTGAFEAIRKLFEKQPEAAQRGLTASAFSFNSGQRCPVCSGNGFEHIEMQFLSDVYLRCSECNGTRYRAELLDIKVFAEHVNEGKSIADVLAMTVTEALDFFRDEAAILAALKPLADVGLSYLTLGQPVPTLSGGEAQRLKLAAHLIPPRQKRGRKQADAEDNATLFIFDEPTTGLHFADIEKLLGAFEQLLLMGHSLIVIEHNLDVIGNADWIVDLGPEGGDQGGQVMFTGKPAELLETLEQKSVSSTKKTTAKTRKTVAPGTASPVHLHAGSGNATALALAAYQQSLEQLRERFQQWQSTTTPRQRKSQGTPGIQESALPWHAANLGSETPDASEHAVARELAGDAIVVQQARENNLKDIDLQIPRDKFTVVTGMSGSGKSTLAFDIIFNEGQRRYLESLNAYARQFVQPAARPDVDALFGIPPTVAIEQRTSRGGHKSTVATMTEVYHFLRLLFVKLGTQHCPDCETAIESQTAEAIVAQISRQYRGKSIRLLAPLIVNRKGYYTDLAKWASRKGFDKLRVDGEDLDTNDWPRLDRFREHSIELPVGTLEVAPENELVLQNLVQRTLDFGKGMLMVDVSRSAKGKRKSAAATPLFSTKRACPQCQRSFKEADPRMFSYNSAHGWCTHCYGTGKLLPDFDAETTGEEESWLEQQANTVCQHCNGQRLNPESLHVRFKDESIAWYTHHAVGTAAQVFRKLKLNQREQQIAADILTELQSRLDFLNAVGLAYLTLDRAAPSLSGGEAQRIRLAAQLGSNLRGVCYILDEPTIGLHPRDNRMLLDTLAALRKKGNTVIVVEHDEDTIREAEHIVDIGPGAGVRGGEVVATGSVARIMRNKNSITGSMLAEPLSHPMMPRRNKFEHWLEVEAAAINNLRSITTRMPLNALVCVTGVSGSGKSSLVRGVIFENLQPLNSMKRKRTLGKLRGCNAITGWESITRVLEVDQTPIGKTPRSCPATYIGFWDNIRRLFADTTEARIRGYSPSRFSFNVKGGRCDECDGQGVRRIEMNFLPDVKVPCDVCNGERFNAETQSVLYRGHTIGDVLNMNIDDAVIFFNAHPSILHPLKLLQAVGLGYLTLGQQSPTLSGGEAQRIKLVSELAKSKPGLPEDSQSAAGSKMARRTARAQPHTLYVLDEPTVGLHMADVEKLIRVLHQLVASGNSVILIEHNIDLMAEADWIVDMGPEGGSGGGKVVTAGSPEKVARSKRSHTAAHLRAVLERAAQSETEQTSSDPTPA